MPEFKPVSGKGVGMMERKDQAHWGPLPASFSERVVQLNANLTTSARKALKSDFDVPMLKRKFSDFKTKYKECKIGLKVCRHLQHGESGGANGDLPCSVQDAIDQDTMQWPCLLRIMRHPVKCSGSETTPTQKRSAQPSLWQQPLLQH
jgi:hypothetical protein